MCLPKHKSQATSSSGAQGRAGKPQFITKMENDTSLHASPGEGLIYDCARARDIRQRRATRTPSAGALIAVLLATGVKDALRIGYLLLFIIKARQPGSGPTGVTIAGSPSSPLPTWPPLPHPYRMSPTARPFVPIHLPAPRRGWGQFLGPQACAPNIDGDSAQRRALLLVSCGTSLHPRAERQRETSWAVGPGGHGLAPHPSCCEQCDPRHIPPAPGMCSPFVLWELRLCRAGASWEGRGGEVTKDPACSRRSTLPATATNRPLGLEGSADLPVGGAAPVSPCARPWAPSASLCQSGKAFESSEPRLEEEGRGRSGRGRRGLSFSPGPITCALWASVFPPWRKAGHFQSPVPPRFQGPEGRDHPVHLCGVRGERPT